MDRGVITAFPLGFRSLRTTLRAIPPLDNASRPKAMSARLHRNLFEPPRINGKEAALSHAA
jgi:hypothetical protein